MQTLVQQLNEELADSAEGLRRSLVQIRNGGRGAGAGTIWHSDGLIVTNAHVVGRGPLKATLADGRTLPARLLARDTDLDVAALAVEATDLPTVAVGETTSLEPGQLVMALGHPWGVVGAVTMGVVVGVGSDLPEMPQSKREWIAVSLNLRPGNSGGPLVDVQGRLVGINTLMTGLEVGMAVPVHVVKRFLREALGS